MRKYLLPLLVLALAACSKPKETSNPTADSVAAQVKAVDKDELAIRTLIRKALVWSESKEAVHWWTPFIASPDSSFALGIDFNQHQNNLKRLEASGLFTPAFIANYDSIIHTIDRQTQAGFYGQFHAREDPPLNFASDVNPLCHCNENDPWEEVEVRILKQDSNKVEVAYYWPVDPAVAESSDYFPWAYRFNVVKQGDKWLIDWMQEFDYPEAIKQIQY